MGLPILNEYIAIYIVLTMRYRAPAAYGSPKLRPPGPAALGAGRVACFSWLPKLVALAGPRRSAG
jgi:hypothetical protein